MELISAVDLDIKQRIKLISQSIEKNKFNGTELMNLSKDCLSNIAEIDIIHEILDLGHLKNVSQNMSEQNFTEPWFSLLNQLIERSNYNVGYILRQRSKRYEGNVAFKLVKKGNLRSLTYDGLWQLVLEVGRSISQLDINQKKTTIGILSNNQLNGVLVDLACLSFGHRVVPLPLNATPHHIKYILQHAEITHLFLGGKIGNKIWSELSKELPVTTISLDNVEKLKESLSWDQFLETGDKASHFDVDERLASVDIRDTQSIMYTSGTTDNPKGITFNQLNMISKRFSRALALPDIGSSDVFLCYLPLYHTFGRYFELMGSIFWGATYSFAESPAFNSLLNDFKIIKPTIFISIPKRWVQLYEMLDNNLELDSEHSSVIEKKLSDITGGSLKWGLSAAGYLDPDIFMFFQKHGIQLLSGYGMTEATGGITMTPPNDYQPESVGKALPGIELKLAEDGELCLKGPYVTKGYFKEDDSEVFIDEWFHTQDIFREKEKHYYIVDRKKDIYKNTRGQTIAPQKIENLFQDFESIKSVFLVGDGREFNTVLIYPNYDADRIDLDPGKVNEVRDLHSSMILSVNSFLSPFERIVNYVLINRNFSKEKGELTPKGTFIRKKILKNFENIIAPLYEKNYLSLHYEDKEIRIPNWIIREIGTLKSNINWDGQTLSINDRSRSLLLNWGKDRIHLGDYSYSYDNDILDLNSLIQAPNLWLGNFGFTDFVGPTVFRLKETKVFDELKIDQVISSKKFDKNTKQNNVGTVLFDIHNAVRLFIEGDLSSFNLLQDIIDDRLGNWSTVMVDTIINFRDHQNTTFRIKLIETIAPLVSGELFMELLKNAYAFHRKKDSTKGFTFSINRTNDDHFHSLIEYLKKIKRTINSVDAIEQEFIKTLLLLVADFGILHPTRFIWARSELVSWQSNKVPKPLYSTGLKAYYSLIKGFRSWIGQSSNIGVDRDTGEEYHWKDIIMFDDNIRHKHRAALLKAISETSLIKESIFIFSKNSLIDLNEIPREGIWITHIGNRNHKKIFRLIVKTRNFGKHNLVINLNEDLKNDSINDETIWLIKMGSGFKEKPLSENFGGYWPEYNLYTEEYIQGETLDRYLKRNEKDINDKVRVDRWQMRWLHFIWNGIQAYQEFWGRSNLERSIQPPSPENLIIPQHDYKTGTRIISISDIKPVESFAEHFLSLYTDFIIVTEKKYPGLRHMPDWEVIFTATIQALKIDEGRKVLEKLKSEFQDRNTRKKCQLTGLTAERIDQFLNEIYNLGVLTKPVVFAALRYERWLELNPEATMQAKSSILQDLYKDYDLNGLLDEYPETRVRFFMMTCFKESDQPLFNEFKSIIKDMRQNVISPWGLQERISNIQLSLELNDEEKFFLARMLFPNVDSADYIELVATNHGQEARLNLVSQTECKDGKLYRIRPPFLPKEIAKFHNLLTESALSVTFTSTHEFLLAFNSRNRLVGGLYWKSMKNDRIHLEWVIIRKKYQKIELSKRIMTDFFKRMKHEEIELITVGFYAQEFFSKYGFKIEKQHGGMVKRLS